MLRGLLVYGFACLLGCAGGQKSTPAGSDTGPGQAGQISEPVYEGSDDPCASRLHDICGVMLLHVLTYGDLPASLAELGPGPGGGDLPPLVCPVSQQPYIYNPFGIYLADQRARLVVYDPAPSHAGMRWGIIAVEATEVDPLVCKVVALPESFFVLRPPQ